MPAQRLFVSLEVPASVAEALVRLNPGLPGVRWVAVEQLHLALAFLGQVAPELAADLRRRLAVIHFSRFFLPLQGIGIFPAKGRPKVIWLGVGRGHPHLFQLHKRVTDAALAAGIEPDLRSWHPHFILARCQDVAPQKVSPFLRAQADFDAGLVPIEAFQLKSRQLTPNGSIYATELAVPAL
ncbi:MAG: RNA 2',3'-cyclic phosphodiesterase [Chthoniobacterales bacterium]|nr:RNA 2',3'-cyclic phosphodiesterase [Chthoniobacterales bacterium]